MESNDLFPQIHYHRTDPESYVGQYCEADSAKVGMQAMLVWKGAKDVLAAEALAHLSCDGMSEKPLVDLESLMFRLSPRVLPLLPQQPEYFPQSERVAPSAVRVSRVDEMNSFLAKGNGGQYLCLPASMFNHDNKPNVGKGKARDHGPIIYAATRNIQKGEELTMTYSEGRNVEGANWGRVHLLLRPRRFPSF